MQPRLKPRRTLRTTALVLACEASVSCKSFKDEKPYTPFGVASVVHVSPSAVPSALETPKTLAFATETALSAPKTSGQDWTLNELHLVAPAGFSFDLGLSADFDADGKPEAVTWVVATNPDERLTHPAELWLHTSAGTRRRLTQLPGFIPNQPACPLQVKLERTGPQTVTLDARANCKDAVVPRSPVRGLVVLKPSAEKPTLLTLRVTDPAPGESLDLRVVSVDQDADGRDDVEINVSLSHGTGEVARAPLRWLDRASGPARDSKQPGLAAALNASKEVARSQGPGTSKSVASNISNQRRLLSALCSEGAVPRVLMGDGAPIVCGPLPTTVARLLTAEFNAALELGRFDEAAAVLLRADWYFEPVKEDVRKGLEKRWLGRVKERLVDLAVFSSALAPATSTPRWSPLSYEADGALLVQTATGSSRIAAGGTEATPVADATPAARSWKVLGPQNQQWVGATLSCSTSEVLLTFSAADGSSQPPLPIELLAPRPGPCGTALRAVQRPTLTPVAWTPAGLSARVAGSLIGPVVPAAPDSNYRITATPWGLLVMGAGQPELWRGAESAVPPPPELRDCVIDNAARSAACAWGSRVARFTPRG